MIENPLLAFGNGHGFGQQAVHLDHIDAAVAHLGHEIEVVALGVLHPHHIVEQQVVAIAGRQALMRAARCTDHDLAQLPDFRVDAEFGFAGSCHNELLGLMVNGVD